VPTCQSCHKEWSWKQTFISSAGLDTAMKCPFCDTKQYPDEKTRKRTYLLSIMILLPMLLPFFGISSVISFVLIFFLGGLVLLVHPFYTQVTN
jgi:CXXC-20-CXXC protein